jgi:hypothetical protein
MNEQLLGDVAFYGITALVALLIFAGLFLLAWRIYRMFSKKAEGGEEETAAINQTVHKLSEMLAEVEKDSNRAGVLLSDAENYTMQLVKLVQGIALKAERMVGEIETLNFALTAIAGRDPLRIAEAAGRVRDEHIRTLMLCKVRNDEYWQDTAMLISAQVGTLAQWERGYRTFASNLLADVSQAKARAAALTAALELTGASRPLLQIEAWLGQAAGLLQLEGRPGLRQAAKELPSVNAGLLLK